MRAVPLKPIKFKVRRLPRRYREFFLENMQMLLVAGLQLDDVFDSMQEVKRTGRFQDALKRARADVEGGMPLWQALRMAGLVSAQAASLIHIGEQSGQLAANLEIAARMEIKQRALQNHIKTAMIYPIFVLVLTFSIGLAVVWFLLPRLEETFSQLGAEMPAMTKALLGAGHYLQHSGKQVVPLAVASAVLLGYLLFLAPFSRWIGFRIMLRTPLLGRLLKEVEIAKFGHLLSALLNAGLSITDAFEMLIDTTEAPQFKSFYMRLHEKLSEGKNFKASLYGNERYQKLLPITVRQMLVAGEYSGNMAKTMSHMATSYEEKIADSAKRLEVLLEPIMLLIVWAIVMLLAVNIVVPIYQLVGQGLQ